MIFLLWNLFVGDMLVLKMILFLPMSLKHVQFVLCHLGLADMKYRYRKRVLSNLND